MTAFDVLSDPLRIVAGEDWTPTITYTVDGNPVSVASPASQIRTTADATGDLILDLAGYITETSPGVLTVAVPYAVTQALPPGTYWWDLFGVVGGVRKQIVPTRPITVVGSVTVS